MIEALVEIGRKLVPEVLSELVHLARLALGGATESEIFNQAQKFARLAVFKQSYHRPNGGR